MYCTDSFYDSLLLPFFAALVAELTCVWVCVCPTNIGIVRGTVSVATIVVVSAGG